MIILLGAALSLAMVIIVITMLIRRQLREKYAVLWLVIGVAALILAASPPLLVALTDLAGAQVPANLFFGGAIVLLVGVALHLSWELSRAEDEIRRLAEESAVNRLEFERLRDRIHKLEEREDPSSPRRHSDLPTDDSDPTRPVS